MKGIMFVGQSLDGIRRFSEPARHEAGYQLERVQRGLEPTDWKPMGSIGRGVREIRIRQEGQYCVIYSATIHDRVCVLHAFRKKSQRTSQKDIEAAKRALKVVLQG